MLIRLLPVLLLLAGWASSFPVSAQLIVDAEDAYVKDGPASNFGGGALVDNGRTLEIHRGGDWNASTRNFNDLFQWISNASRAGGHSVGLKTAPSSRPGNGNQRNEYVIYKDQSVPRGTKKYTGFSFQLKSGEWSAPDDWFVPWQWKQAPNSTAESQQHGNFPLVTLYFEEDGSNRMYFHSRYGDYGWTDTNKPRGRKITMEKIDVGVWYDVVIGLKFDADGTTGWTYCWLKKANERNYRQYGWKDIQVGYKRQPRVMDWNKFGIYRGASSKNNVMYFDEVRYGNTFAEVKIPGSNDPGTSSGGSGQLIANGTYYIRSNRNGQNILSNAGTNHRAKAHNAGNFSDQKWEFRHLGDNVYTMKNLRTNRYLEVPYARCGNGIQVATWTGASANHQKWKAVKVGSNYQFRPLHCQSTALDLAGGQTNAFLHIWGQNTGNQNQIWRVLTAPKSAEAEAPTTMRAYPNPTTGRVVLAFDHGLYSDGEVTVMDFGGRVVLRQAVTAGSKSARTISVDLSALPSAAYVVRFVNEEVNVVERVLRR